MISFPSSIQVNNTAIEPDRRTDDDERRYINEKMIDDGARLSWRNNDLDTGRKKRANYLLPLSRSFLHGVGGVAA